MEHKCIQEIEINTLKINQQNMADNIQEIKQDIKEIKKFITEDIVKQLDSKYASKLTEVIVYALCGCILLAFLAVIIPWK